MKSILVILTFIVLVAGGAYEAFSASSPKKTANRDSSSGPTTSSANHEDASSHSLTRQNASVLLKDIGEVVYIKPSPVKGLYEVKIRQKNRLATVYLDFAGKHLLPGPVFEIATKRSLTPPPEDLPRILSKKELDNIPLANSVILGNPAGKKRMFVFTDPDCPFCGRLHGELKKLVTMEPELAVYIKMYPLAMHPEAYDKARVILGSKSLELLEKAFAGGKLPEPTKDDGKMPVDETIRLGKALEIAGTPAMIFPNGRLKTGAISAAAIRELLVLE
ncbi:MAG: DsbC family protein [Geobacteraceae bacterium]|nr:DsbC family protein [Geobacteraceae bacterium]